MGFSEKHQVDRGQESESKKWVIAGISVRAPLKQIKTKNMEKDVQGEEERSPTTPTAEDATISASHRCPKAPRKPRPSLRCSFDGEFFTPPELESVFIRSMERVERAN